MKDFLAIAKALSDESRVRALTALARGELCVCQIIELLGLAPSTVSKHMVVLHQAGLVETRKDGRWVYYRLAGRGASRCALDAVEWLQRCMKRDTRAVEDRRRVAKVRRMSPTDLCTHYRR